MSKRIAQGLGALLCVFAMSTISCAQSPPMNRSNEVRTMLTRELPLGMHRDTVLAKLDSLQIPYTALDSGHTAFRALVRNTSRSALATGHLQILFRFGPDSVLQQREFKEVLGAPSSDCVADSLVDVIKAEMPRGPAGSPEPHASRLHLRAATAGRGFRRHFRACVIKPRACRRHPTRDARIGSNKEPHETSSDIYRAPL